MAKLVSKTYGDALFELALEEHVVDRLFEEVQVVSEVLAASDDLIKILNQPKIDKEEKLHVIENVFKGRVSDQLTGFIILVVNKERYNELSSIFEYFLARVKEYKGIGIAYVSSAIELKDAQKKSVEAALLKTTSYQSFEMHYEVKKELIGGMVIRIGDRVVDSSIKSKLESMTRELVKIQLKAVN